MAFTIVLYVNGLPIKDYTVRRVKGDKHQPCEYRLHKDGKDYGEPIEHHYDDGPEALAIRVLKKVSRRARRCTQ